MPLDDRALQHLQIFLQGHSGTTRSHQREQSRTEQKTENNNSRQTEQQKLDRQTEKTHAPMLQKEMQTWPHRHVDANRKPIKG